MYLSSQMQLATYLPPTNVGSHFPLSEHELASQSSVQNVIFLLVAIQIYLLILLINIRFDHKKSIIRPQAFGRPRLVLRSY